MSAAVLKQGLAKKSTTKLRFLEPTWLSYFLASFSAKAWQEVLQPVAKVLLYACHSHNSLAGLWGYSFAWFVGEEGPPPAVWEEVVEDGACLGRQLRRPSGVAPNGGEESGRSCKVWGVCGRSEAGTPPDCYPRGDDPRWPLRDDVGECQISPWGEIRRSRRTHHEAEGSQSKWWKQQFPHELP